MIGTMEGDKEAGEEEETNEVQELTKKRLLLFVVKDSNILL